jgi:hypothetical protein
VSVFVTLLFLPLWRWIEERLHVESVGHSGPAGWCFLASYALHGPQLYDRNDPERGFGKR